MEGICSIVGISLKESGRCMNVYLTSFWIVAVYNDGKNANQIRELTSTMYEYLPMSSE
jgi:hypothetical protein